MSETTIPPQVRIGHVHLKVSDLDRSMKFYRDVLGFEVQQYYGKGAAYLSAGGYHHHIGLNTWESRGGTPPPSRSTGLYHVGILYPSRKELAIAVKRLIDHGVAIDSMSDQGVSESVYVRDPDFNSLELYCDRDPSQWPRSPDGELRMITDPLDLASLLSELENE